MPGLAGIITQNPGEENNNDVRAMLACIQHESFYSSGTYANGDAGVYVGWSCHEGSYCDGMPIKNREGDRLLFFYGENYADQEALNDMGTRGYAVTDAGYVLSLYEEKGMDFLGELNGWFHGLLLDTRQNQVLLFNDRYGMQRLHVYEDADSLLFASEAKALLAVRSALRTLDPRGVGEILTCGCVLQDRTLFANLSTMPAGSAWTFGHRRLQKKSRYFQAKDWESQSLLEQEEIYDHLEALFGRVMTRHTASTSPIGFSLTGGLDTRLIMAYMAGRETRMPCYTFGGMYRDSFDVKVAREVAAACGFDHEVIPVGEAFMASFPTLAEETVYISDGCLSVCGAYELYLNRLARRIAGVRLTGNYGSEVLRSAGSFKPVHPTMELIHPDFHTYIHDAIHTWDGMTGGRNLSFRVFKQAPWYGYGRLAVEQSQVVMRTPFMDNNLVGLMYRAPEGVRSTDDTVLRLIERAKPSLVGIPTDRGLYGRSGLMPSRWVHGFTEFQFKADYCYKSGMPQWMEQLHYLLGPLQPERWLIGRHRFAHFRVWFRRELAANVRDVVLDPGTARRPYVNGSFLETMVNRHIKGDRNYTNEIEKVFTMELVHRLFADGAALPPVPHAT